MFGSLFEDFQGFQLVMNFMVMPLFFFSGSIFPLDNVPTVLLWIARFNPLTYGIDAIRYLLVAMFLLVMKSYPLLELSSSRKATDFARAACVVTRSQIVRSDRAVTLLMPQRLDKLGAPPSPRSRSSIHFLFAGDFFRYGMGGKRGSVGFH